jgi:protein-tyrosine kinase
LSENTLTCKRPAAGNRSAVDNPKKISAGEIDVFNPGPGFDEVKQLGKIHDALEKSSRELKLSYSENKGFNVIVNREGGKGKASSDQIPEPGASAGVDQNLVALLDPQSFEAEQFKILRTHLLFPGSGNLPRSIMVTSAAPGEGKTFVAANLAVTIAQNINEHVLLMDGDLRRPCIHSRFGFNRAPGLSEYLLNGTRLSEFLLKTGIEKLTILPGGNPPHNPSELLSSKKMSELLEQVTTRYSDRYVIVDSPPPQLAAETRAIAKQVDGILIVVKSGGTPREMVADLVEMMGKEKVLGVVFNRFDIRSSGYYGYRRYNPYKKYYGPPA